jgi:hypothetical protein
VAKEELEKSIPLIMTFSYDDFESYTQIDQTLERILGKISEPGFTITNVKVKLPSDT